MTVSFSRRGDGSPVVLVHGLGSRWQVFAPVLDALSAHHDVLAVDLPGFGASPLMPGVEPGVPGYVRWLTGWLADQGIERPHIVGNSMGGAIALELGRDGTAGGVTAFSPAGFWRGAGIRWAQGMLTASRGLATHARPVVERALEHPAGRVATLGGLFGRPTHVDPADARADVAALVEAAGFVPARDSFTGYRFPGPAGPGRLADIPVTVAWGTRDVLLTHRTQSARARAALPQARHVDLPGCGHLPFSDDPQACASLVLADAARVEAAR